MVTPRYLGPNALPVPFITNGSIDSINSFGVTGSFHFSKGDITKNIAVYANYCLVKDRISFDIFLVPIEWFNMSHQKKEERHVYAQFYYKRWAKGDLHLNTNIKLFNSKNQKTQSSLRIGYRFPTSSGLGVARYTDAPGYYLDISFGRFLKAPQLKWITMVGGYFWQAENFRRQDDAFLFGSGLEFNRKGTRIQSYFTGYLGYFDAKGDQPVLFRTNIETNLKRNTLLLRFQQGLQDFYYTSVEAGMKYNFKKSDAPVP